MSSIDPAQLVQTRVGEVDLTLDTHGSNDLEPGRRRDQLLQQRRLPDPRLAVHQERTARAPSHGRQQRLERCKLALAADEGA